MLMKTLLLASTLGASAATAHARDQAPCAAFTGEALGGQRVTDPAEAITQLPPKTGSVLIPTGYGVSLYPSQLYVGVGLTLTGTNDLDGLGNDPLSYLMNPAPGGKSIDLAKIYDRYPFFAFPTTGVGSLHCFKLGTVAAPAKAIPVSVFYNNVRFENFAISAHGSDKIATLTNVDGKKQLQFGDSDPDNGFYSYTVDLDSGDVEYYHSAVHGFPEVHKTVTPADTAAYQAALAVVRQALDDNFGERIAGSYPNLAPAEGLKQVRALLSVAPGKSPF